MEDSHLCQEETPSSHLAGGKNLISQYTPTRALRFEVINHLGANITAESQNKNVM